MGGRVWEEVCIAATVLLSKDLEQNHSNGYSSANSNSVALHQSVASLGSVPRGVLTVDP